MTYKKGLLSFYKPICNTDWLYNHKETYDTLSAALPDCSDDPFSFPLHI